MKIIANNEKNNHLETLKKLAIKSDTLIIVSPFITSELSNIIKDMPTIKKITLYTTLQKYTDTPNKIVSLYNFYQYCKECNIDLLIKIDDDLHGKVYLFYNNVNATGFLLTSGNFTENGLMNNHEYGLLVVDEKLQKEMANIITSINTYDLTYNQLLETYDKANSFIKSHPAVVQEKFDVSKLMNKKPSTTQNGTRKYYLKPVGTSGNPFTAPNVIKDNDLLGFAKKPNGIKKGDVLLLHSVGPSSIVGYYVVTSDSAFKHQNDKLDRWQWKVQAECHSSKFSSEWWKKDLKTQELVKEFLKTNEGKHITNAGGNTLGALKWGSDKIQLTCEFAQYIIEKISE